MIYKHIDSTYKDSHKKTEKSFAKALDIKQSIGENSQLHSFTASQLHSFTAEGFLCPNKIKYQLLKPRPKTACRPKTDFLYLGFFCITPFNKTARNAKR